MKKVMKVGLFGLLAVGTPIGRSNHMRNHWLVTVILGLVLALVGTPSRAQQPPGNDISDVNDNTGGGSGALVNNSQGTFNTAYGHDALRNNFSGILNTAVGQGALTTNVAGFENTAVGAGALTNNLGAPGCASSSCGSNNTAIGFQALFTMGKAGFGGAFNTAVGSNALFSTDSSANLGGGHRNTAVGNNALFSNGEADSSTAVGDSALLNASGNNLTSGANIAIGASAGSNLTSGSNNIYLGNSGESTESKTMRLGSVQTRTFIAGIYGAHVSARQVFVNSNGELGTLASSARYKRDIQSMGDRSRGLLKLRPVTFHYKFEPDGELQYGLIAEEVAKVYPDLVTKGVDGKVESVQYHELIPMLLNELQQQEHSLEAQAQQLAQLKAENARLQAVAMEQNATFSARLERLEAVVRNSNAGSALRLSSLATTISVGQP